MQHSKINLPENREVDEVLTKIADYVCEKKITSILAYETAYSALLDSLGCAFLALKVPQCKKLLGPIVEGTIVPKASRVPGTSYQLDPIKAAFDIGTCIRWLDYNDTWLAQEWGHPSDNLGAILAVGDYVSNDKSKDSSHLTVKDVLTAMIKAYEIQGILALENAFNRVGLDHVILVKIASAAVIAPWMGLSKDQTIEVLSHAFIDGHSLRTYRHAPNTGPRKSWAAGDATSRAVFLNWLVLHGQIGYPKALSAKRWGFVDVLFQGKPIVISRPFESYVMENILFKVAYPAEFHAQTAVEASFKLHQKFKDRLKTLENIEEIEKIEIQTQAPAIRIIDKTGPLYNYADRDHCIQYMVAIGLLYGELKPEHYSDEIAKDPRIDSLREKMKVSENQQFSQDYLDPNKRAIPNSIQIFFKDGIMSDQIIVEYPLGHQRRRKEAEPLLKEKYNHAVKNYFSGEQQTKILELWDKKERVLEMKISDFISLFGGQG